MNAEEKTMNGSKRNLVIGLVGMALLLIAMLVYAQVSAAYNYDLGLHVGL